jgi:hypothetical protein
MGDEYLDRFLNALLNDTSYCLEEGITNLKKIKEYELKTENGHVPSREERSNHKQDEKTCIANMQLSKHCLKSLK